MKIHEYQGKQLFRKYGVPVPIGIPAMTVGRGDRRDPEGRSKTPARDVVVVKAQIHAGGRGKGGGVKVAKTARRRRGCGREDLRHAARHARRPAPRARRCSACSSSRASTSRTSSTSACCSTARPRRVDRDGVDRGRHGHRGGRGASTPRRSSRTRSTRRPAGRTASRASSRRQLGLTGKAAERARQVPDGADPLLRGDGLLAARDQPARSSTKDGRVLALDAKINFDDNALFRHPELEEPARPRRGGRRGARGQEVGPQLHLARRQHRLHGQRRGPRDGDDGHHQVLRRQAGQLPRRRRRRDRGEGHRRVQDHHARSRT